MSDEFEEETSRWSPRFWTGFGLAALIVGGLVAREDIRAWQAQDWPEAKAKVVSCRVDTMKRRQFHLAVRYEYTVDGQRHTSDRFDFAANATRDRNLATQFAEGRMVTCFYNPKNPSEAVLYRGFGGTYQGLEVVLLVFSLGCFGKAIREVFRQRREDAATDLREAA